MLFFFLIALATALPTEKIIPNAHIVKNTTHTASGHKIKSKTSLVGRDFLSEIKSNPKKFMSEAQNLDPGSVSEVIALLEALLESSRSRENDLLTDMNNAQDALDNSNNELVAAEDALDQANNDLANAENAQANAVANEAAARDDHTAKTGDHDAASQLYNEEIGSLDDEQQVLEQVIAMMNGLLEDAPTASPPQLSEQNTRDACAALGGAWSVRWTGEGALVCGTVGAGSDCNGCDTWRLMVWENGAKDQASGGADYQTVAGSYYGGHSPCTVGWNLPLCGDWA